MTSEMNCPKCGAELMIMVDVTVKAPAKYIGNFTKSNFRLKEFELWGVNWEKQTLYCSRPECRWTNWRESLP